MVQNRPAKTPNNYISPLTAGIEFEFVSAHTIYPYGYGITGTVNKFYQRVTLNGNQIWDNAFNVTVSAIPPNIIEGEDIGFKTILKAGTYVIFYSYDVDTPGSSPQRGTAKYTFEVVQNKYPLKKWTITDVINRVLDIAEPIYKGERPRFRLNGMRADGTIITEKNKQEGEEVGQAALFDTVLAPQFAFTKNTLREILQQIGKVIHGEPKLRPKKDANGWYGEVWYDIYGSGRMSKISKHKPYLIETSHAVENFCSSLDSSVENLINSLDRYSGVIKDPYGEGFKTVRTENTFVRVTDTNMIISTTFPIYSVEKLEYYDDNVGTVDITAYLFEGSEYSRLSSYSAQYPQAKLYALRFKQGEKNIDGLNFKRQRTSDTATLFGDYSIVAIIKQATGNSSFSIDETKYPEMRFRVTYAPIYSTRISQTKPYYKEVRRPASLFFNQTANLVETKYYGENMKGAVARLGNVEKSISYILFNVYSIPKAGDMYDEDYMISGVAVEWLPTYIKCTIALTKSFNRISQYIGVSSVRRYSEISETQAVERNPIYQEYVVIGEEETPDADTRIGNGFMVGLSYTFIQEYDYNHVNAVIAWGESYQGEPTAAVILPVISSAFGNSISFSWEYADNYSAGNSVEFHTEGEGDETISGYFQNAFRYTDNYGRIYYYHFDLRTYIDYRDVTVDTPFDLPAYGGNIPPLSYDIFSTVGKQPYILRKDNREALQVSVQVNFVTNLKDMIIGSALGAYCPLVRGTDKSLKAKLYFFPDRLEKFIDHVEGSVNAPLDSFPSATINVSDPIGGLFNITAENFPVSGKAWAIVTEQTYGDQQMVEDETGNVFEQREVKGGDVLIARNMDFSEGDAFPPIYFTAKREVFDKTVWKDRR